MGILHAYDPNPVAVIEPSEVMEPVKGFPAIAVSAFEQATIDAAIRVYGAKQIDCLHCGIDVPVYAVEYKGTQFALYLSVLGGPASAGLMEEMIAKGTQQFVFFGVCGVLDRSLSEGAIIVPTAAYRDEGVSHHYLPYGDYLHIQTAEALVKLFEGMHVPFKTGRTWTTDAIYRETRGKIEQRRNEGCNTVEMECASLMAVSEFRKIPAYQFLYAGDNLDSEVWDARILGAFPRNYRERYLRIALETALRLSECNTKP